MACGAWVVIHTVNLPLTRSKLAAATFSIEATWMRGI
jgi:hypothetical protein